MGQGESGVERSLLAAKGYTESRGESAGTGNFSPSGYVGPPQPLTPPPTINDRWQPSEPDPEAKIDPQYEAIRQACKTYELKPCTVGQLKFEKEIRAGARTNGVASIDIDTGPDAKVIPHECESHSCENAARRCQSTYQPELAALEHSDYRPSEDDGSDQTPFTARDTKALIEISVSLLIYAAAKLRQDFNKFVQQLEKYHVMSEQSLNDFKCWYLRKNGGLMFDERSDLQLCELNLFGQRCGLLQLCDDTTKILYHRWLQGYSVPGTVLGAFINKTATEFAGLTSLCVHSIVLYKNKLGLKTKEVEESALAKVLGSTPEIKLTNFKKLVDEDGQLYAKADYDCIWLFRVEHYLLQSRAAGVAKDVKQNHLKLIKSLRATTRREVESFLEKAMRHELEIKRRLSLSQLASQKPPREQVDVAQTLPQVKPGAVIGLAGAPRGPRADTINSKITVLTMPSTGQRALASIRDKDSLLKVPDLRKLAEMVRILHLKELTIGEVDELIYFHSNKDNGRKSCKDKQESFNRLLKAAVITEKLPRPISFGYLHGEIRRRLRPSYLTADNIQKVFCSEAASTTGKKQKLVRSSCFREDIAVFAYWQYIDVMKAGKWNPDTLKKVSQHWDAQNLVGFERILRSKCNANSVRPGWINRYD